MSVGPKPELAPLLAAQVDAAVGWQSHPVGSPGEREIAVALRNGMRRAPDANPFPARTDEIVVDGLTVRIYRPAPPDASESALPAVLFLHGGGWVGGDLETNDDACRRLAAGVSCVVVSVDYSLAPEVRYPVAIEEGWAVLQWIRAEIEGWGGDPGRLAVAGSSAGGNLAAVLARRARGAGFPLLAQLLIYPVLDSRTTTQSYADNATGYLLTANQMRFYWSCYLGDQDVARRDEVSPGTAVDLAGLPATYIITAELDPLRDEAEGYGAALAAAGVPAVVCRFPGQIHGFVAFTAVTGDAVLAIDRAAAWLASRLHG